MALWCGVRFEYSERHFFGPVNFVKILVSNDDGHLARGINVLADALSEIAEVVVVAPDRNHSGASNSLTLTAPLRTHKVREGRFYVNGTPSDCVHLALSEYIDFDPDIIVSGINHGANLGDDVIYSGTVAAAMEGRFLGLPAIAISLVGSHAKNFETAGRVARELVEKLDQRPLPGDTLLNVNVPDLPYEELNGMRTTRLGFRHRSEPIIRETDPRGYKIYWIGPPGEGHEDSRGTDFHAIKEGAVAVTPLQVDLTRHSALTEIEEWLG